MHVRGLPSPVQNRHGLNQDIYEISACDKISLVALSIFHSIISGFICFCFFRYVFKASLIVSITASPAISLVCFVFMMCMGYVSMQELKLKSERKNVASQIDAEVDQAEAEGHPITPVALEPEPRPIIPDPLNSVPVLPPPSSDQPKDSDSLGTSSNNSDTSPHSDTPPYSDTPNGSPPRIASSIAILLDPPSNVAVQTPPVYEPKSKPSGFWRLFGY